MKKFWILAIIGVSIVAHGKELATFSEIVHALTKGISMKMVVQLDERHPTFYTEVSAVMLQPTYLQFADTHLTTNHPGFEKIPVLENVTYRISDNGEVRITTRVIALPDYQILTEHSMGCVLGGSATVFTGAGG